MIEPHGGTLINRIATADERGDLLDYLRSLKQITVDAFTESDLELIANGAFSPLDGFMTGDQYTGVLESMHLPSGLAWSIPITLAVPEFNGAGIGSDLTLVNNDGDFLALLHVEDVFERNPQLEADLVYKTRDPAHPGVKRLLQQQGLLVGGRIVYVGDWKRKFPSCYSPMETRAIFEQRRWKTIVAFQTRNPIHRAHEYIQKCALETVDGLFLHPLVGETKGDDVPAEIRMRCYEVLLEKYYPQDRTFLSVFPAAMRYAGPREAIFHAIVRKNYGATHFIVGRDHAGVGNYYGTYDAQKIFYRFDPSELGITPLFFDYTFYCKGCGQMASEKTCNHQNGSRVYLSGSKIREYLSAGLMLPEEFTRPEISRILIESYRSNQPGGEHGNEIPAHRTD